ncbi:hypothetical protein ASPSYDRAFT_40896 [Aspergillus sydowii CBS 593.65]|uniref:Uncharacterized protein n=1 Tax=Aspergillus sydowii CBS 593.65 TaxID=1036612 RepID=A0A1L9TS62_9EURO|nr:uncharacterized protein ASPSYDRAFT_40896 [Aspergillus sydowii CBS 593.65]OJJ62262.1 hypothetical protein ASPSYDRAFT_40896 [Aspergillus sydowii CBS 593.65]
MAPRMRFPRGQSRPVRSNRTHVQSYNEESGPDDPLDEDSGTDQEGSRRLSLSLRPRSNRIPMSYRENSSDDELDDFPSQDTGDVLSPETAVHQNQPLPDVATHAIPTTSNRARRTRSVKTRSQTQKSKRIPTKRRLELGRPLNKRRKTEELDTSFAGSGVIPPWQTLPYHILFDVFLRASYPLVEEKSIRRHSTVNWLVNVALLCRNFHEPALAALYHSPPLIPAPKSHGLLSLLVKPQGSLSTNYVNKIKELHVDVETLLVYKSGPTLGYFDLSKLIENTPQINVLRLYHNNDYVVGLPSWEISRSKWMYPEALFASINSASIRLHNWDWNARFMDTQDLLPLILSTHNQAPFKSIRSLRILHVASEDADGDGVTGMADERENVLAMALQELPSLHRLEFLESSILNDHLLPKLPFNLTSLTINNCDDVTTANFSLFLSTHGHSLRELSISHNRHLSLSFIVDLKKFCQSLERLTMDLSMHDWSSYHDVEPHFEELLSPSEIPTWPPTLQHLELVQLRKWKENTAEAFFTSLIEAAPELQNLRKLIISAILKTGWRDRASFREKWIGRLEKVFLRRSAPPNPAFRTIVRHSKGQEPGNPTEGSHLDESEIPSPSKRKSARIASLKYSDGEENQSPSPGSYRMNEGDSDNDLPVTQGMCNVVVIRIDNQRPRETQFNEQDFLDDELSGDEDWTGHDLDLGDGGHAW